MYVAIYLYEVNRYILVILVYMQVELITSKGYPAQTHYVTTSDGYVLALHRIPRLSGNDANTGVWL